MIHKNIFLIFSSFCYLVGYSNTFDDSIYSYYCLDTNRMGIVIFKDTVLHLVNKVDSNNLKTGIWIKRKRKVYYYEEGKLVLREYFFKDDTTKRITLFHEDKKKADERTIRFFSCKKTIRLIKKPKIKGCMNF